MRFQPLSKHEMKEEAHRKDEAGIFWHAAKQSWEIGKFVWTQAPQTNYSG